MAKTGRIGSRGCPACGGHNTEGARTSPVVYWCRTCRHRWFPCGDDSCRRGYKLKLDDAALGPSIVGCSKCGVPDRIARMWPEAYRAMARELDFVKQSALVEDANSSSPAP